MLGDPTAASDTTVYPGEFYTARFVQADIESCTALPCWEQTVSRSKHIYLDRERVAVAALVVDPATVGAAENDLNFLTAVIQYFHSDARFATTFGPPELLTLERASSQVWDSTLRKDFPAVARPQPAMQLSQVRTRLQPRARVKARAVS